MDWREFWDGDTPIYVSERHKALHYRLIARGIVDLLAELPAAAGGDAPSVLDQGCGEALSAEDVAARCARLYLCDAAASVRARLSMRYARDGNIGVLSPPQVADIEEASLDLVVANSLLQYLGPAELASLLKLWRHVLKPSGRLLIADVIPRGLPAAADALALLRFGAQGGFLTRAVVGLARTALSDYRKLRAELGLSTYDEAEMVALLAEAGFAAMRRRPNLGHNQARLAFLATPR